MASTPSPLCINARTADEVVDFVQRIAPTFGGINLEDIKAPECFEIEERLKASLDIPVFHDDQHGTAVVTLAALWNSLKITGKRIEDLTIVIAGMGAAGVAIGKILINAGVGEIIGYDRTGAIYSGRGELNTAKEWFAEHTNPSRKMGSISDVLKGSDVFVGVSGPDLITAADVRNMAASPIVFAMANPDPEIRPEQADGLVAIMATGRSDYPNQINNVLAFPGIFRGALDAGATDITENMKLAAAVAIAESVSDAELSPSFLVPSVFDRTVVDPRGPSRDPRRHPRQRHPPASIVSLETHGSQGAHRWGRRALSEYLRDEDQRNDQHVARSNRCLRRLPRHHLTGCEAHNIRATLLIVQRCWPVGDSGTPAVARGTNSHRTWNLYGATAGGKAETSKEPPHESHRNWANRACGDGSNEQFISSIRQSRAGPRPRRLSLTCWPDRDCPPDPSPRYESAYLSARSIAAAASSRAGERTWA